MTPTGLRQMEHNIARCRVLLSLAAMIVVYVDPEEPLIARWIPFSWGAFHMDPRLLMVMAGHLTYSTMVYLGRGGFLSSMRAAAITTWVDVLFAVAIGTMTEGVTGPSYPFFAFAVVTSGLRGGMRQAALVTTASLALYVLLILLSNNRAAELVIMRPVYLGITGYVVGYLGQQRIDLQEQMRQLEIAEQRHRIGRDLHDGYAQALAGIDLRLEGARRALRNGGAADVLSDLTDLQVSVKREFDDLRRYARTLAGVDPTPTANDDGGGTRVSLRAEVAGSVALVERVLGIAREGLQNIRRHARARHARIDVRGDGSAVRLTIEDDGVGFEGNEIPWSIASRVNEVGGRIEIASDRSSGACLDITLPPR
ncbi:MAG TPA: histidine kinase [Candidatus Binatia bacterium]|nr:histidine kinase [Candidatus Binatia bacterium]